MAMTFGAKWRRNALKKLDSCAGMAPAETGCAGTFAGSARWSDVEHSRRGGGYKSCAKEVVKP